MDWSGRDLPLTAQLSSEPDPAWGVLPASTAEPQAHSRTFAVRCGNKRGAQRRKTQIPPPVPSPRGETTQVPMSWDVGPLPRSLDGIGGLLTRCGAPGGHWQARGRAWGACGPLGAGGYSRGAGKAEGRSRFLPRVPHSVPVWL